MKPRRALIISPAGQIYDRDKVKWYTIPENKKETDLIEKYFNIGDMVVYDSTLKLLDFDEFEPMSIINPTPEQIERYKNFDAVFVRASNFIHNDMHWHKAAYVLQQIDLPVYAVGVGAQASVREKYNLNSENATFWNLVAERSKVIGVRGTFSADVLYSNGIKNVEICGCPSIFRRRNRDLQIKIPDEIRKVAFSIRREVDATYAADTAKYISMQRDLLHDAAKN